MNLIGNFFRLPLLSSGLEIFLKHGSAAQMLCMVLTICRKLLMTYTRFRAMHGARYTRVDWTSLSDLPAPPLTCRRRMALLKKNKHIMGAVKRICNLLGKRYARYLEKERDWKRTILLHQISNTVQENSLDTDSEQLKWDNFEDPEIKSAFDDVLELIRAEKMDQIKRLGHKNERSSNNDNEVTEDITCSQQILVSKYFICHQLLV
jgi:general transcription factor 3C polypeptide 1